MTEDEDTSKDRFLLGCLVLVGILGCGGVLLWTPLPGLLIMWGGPAN